MILRPAVLTLATLAMLGALASLVPAATTSPTTRRAAAGPSDVARAGLRAAIAALSKEYEQFQRDPINASLRESCNYFLDHPNGDVTPEVILTALAAGSGDPRQGCYVKWQLLSGLPAELDEAQQKQLLNVYRAAPLPIPRPGISREDQQRMERLTQSARQGDEPDVLRQVDQAVTHVRRQNGPVLAYRDELYRRLPRTADTFAAALEDLLERGNAAADGRDLLKLLAKDVREWMASDPPAPQTLLALARAARRLADTRGPQYYQTPYWNERAGVFAWRKARASVDSGRTLKELAVLLEEQSQRPPLNLDVPADAPVSPSDTNRK